jgi:hypothetical protein
LAEAGLFIDTERSLGAYFAGDFQTTTNPGASVAGQFGFYTGGIEGYTGANSVEVSVAHVGLVNFLRGDDGWGIALGREIKGLSLFPSGVSYKEAHGDPWILDILWDAQQTLRRGNEAALRALGCE